MQASNSRYEVMHRIIRADNEETRWVNAQATVEFEAGIATRFLGTVLDITEQKQDELRKNDFIGMVSHELKPKRPGGCPAAPIGSAIRAIEFDLPVVLYDYHQRY